MNPSRIAFSVFILCFHQYGFSDKVLGFSLTDLAFEFLPGLDLHLVFNENKGTSKYVYVHMTCG